MDMDAALLNQKLDGLTTLLAMQQRRLELMENYIDGQAAIMNQLERMGAHIEVQSRHQEEMAELRQDLTPVVNQMIKLTIDELADVGTEFQGEDLLFLLKRLLRDTHLLLGLLDRFESTVELADEVQRLTRPAFNQAVNALDRLERDGYFAFARSGWRIVEHIVSEFSEADVDALGDNIVTILTTVKSLTQPQIMAMTNNALQAIQETPTLVEQPSMWALLKDLSDPKVRKGLSRLLNIVKTLADQPGTAQSPN